MDYKQYKKIHSSVPAEILKSGKVLLHSELIQMTIARRSENDIAAYYGITRMSLWKWRTKLYIPKNRLRSDKGAARIDSEAKRLKRNAKAREYRRLNPDKYGYNHSLTSKIFLSVVGRPRKSSEVVHHIDRDIRNNEHSNLIICTQDYHLNVLHT